MPDPAADGWPDESTRPLVTDPAEARDGHPNQQLLAQVHAHLRSELARIVEALDELAASGADVAGGVDQDRVVGDVRAFLQRLASRQDRFSLGAFCAAYCRTVATHHAIEDGRMFPDMAAAEPALSPVIDRLQAEHLVIAGLLERLDLTLVAMVSAGSGLEDLRVAAARLSRVLLSHLAYEEEQLLGPLGRLPLLV